MMALRKLTLGAALAVIACAAPAGAATVVGTDPRFDWGMNYGPGITKVGEGLGEDLVAAEAAVGATHLTFVIKVTVLPATFAGAGNWPAIPRYMWDFAVDGRHFQIDGQFQPEDPAACVTAGCFTAPMRIRGNCRVENTVQVCDELGTVPATYTQGPPSAISIAVPRDLLHAVDGSVVTPVETPFNAQFGGNIIATSLPFSDGLYPADWMSAEAFRVTADGVRLLSEEQAQKPKKKPKRRKRHR